MMDLNIYDVCPLDWLEDMKGFLIEINGDQVMAALERGNSSYFNGYGEFMYYW